jgi:hypothetical protein
MKISRRALLLGMGATPVMLWAQPRPARPKLAAICTTYFKYSHSQHIVDRLLEGISEIRTLAQAGHERRVVVRGSEAEKDQSDAGAKEFGSTVYPTYPVERTLLVSGAVESCLTSRLNGQQRLETP